MSGRVSRLADLARIAALLAERALPPVAAAQERLATAQALIDDMAARRAGLKLDGADPVLAAQLARQAQRLRVHQTMAMADLARAQAELNVAKAAARPVMARKVVLERLVEKTGQKG
jgi:hypothetical protein